MQELILDMSLGRARDVYCHWFSKTCTGLSKVTVDVNYIKGTVRFTDPGSVSPCGCAGKAVQFLHHEEGSRQLRNKRAGYITGT